MNNYKKEQVRVIKSKDSASIIRRTGREQMKVEINKKTLEIMNELFKKEKKSSINTVKGILKRMDKDMEECLVNENKNRKERNYSGALINENYFFALFFLRENILGKELNVHEERKRLLKSRGKNKK